ncbi:hypothetical protein [Acinetobacter sp. SAAs470]|uniref:hypothetical protein n=1 Tax=Acinetobacter sp. SAAs470 TaxID=3036709 RepID=UPI0029348B9E|nr:hypothetical protein [Acinetobacter sp. SAAs470]WOE33272.1 hypothetical protein QSG84_16050 [Acinetobacter sp. SAAs470]
MTPGFAQEKTSNTSSASLELNQVFDIEKFDNIQVLELSRQEMKDTQGAFVPFIPVAVAVGTRFITNQFVSHQIRNGMLAYSTYSAANKMNKNNN